MFGPRGEGRYVSGLKQRRVGMLKLRNEGGGGMFGP